MTWHKDCRNYETEETRFVNTAYDKALAYKVQKRKTDITDTIGTVAITDRHKLYEYLKVLSDSSRYKYIMLDIKFDKDEVTEWDDSLYTLIAGMDRIVFAYSDNMPDHIAGLHERAAHVNWYSTIIDTNFTRMQLCGDTLASLPLRVYQDLEPGHELTRHGKGFFACYTSGGRLCNNSLFVTFDIQTFNNDSIKSRPDGTSVSSPFGHLGRDLYYSTGYTREMRDEQITYETEDKIVVIGDFFGDLIDTYVGAKPGSYVMYRTLSALREGKHMVSWWLVLAWFVVYMGVALFVVRSPIKVRTGIKNRWLRFGSKALSFVMDAVTFSFLLTICVVAEYLFLDRVHSILIPTIYFTLVDLIYRFNTYNND